MKRFVTLLLSALLMANMVPLAFAQSNAEVYLTSTSAACSEDVTIILSVKNCVKAKSMYIVPRYDDEVLEIVSGTWLLNGMLADDWSPEFGDAAIAFAANTDINTDVFKFVFKVKENIDIGNTTSVSCEIVIKTMEGKEESAVATVINNGTITVICKHTNTNNVPKIPANCDEDGYTAGVLCNDCNTYISGHKLISATGHKYGTLYDHNETHHWSICSAENCGFSNENEKAGHTSTGANVATCQKRAVCDVCGVSYGSVADHDLANTLSKDETGHWYACQTEGCTEKHQFTLHTLGQTDRTCTACGYRDYVLGDINNDDDVTLTDVVALAQYVAEWDVVCNEKALDVNGDGDVTLTDVVHLAQYVAQWDGIVLH